MSQGEITPGSAKPPSMTSWLDVLRAALPPRGVLLVGAGAGDGPWVQWLQSRGVASGDVPVLLVEGDEQQYRHLQRSLTAQAGWALRCDVVAARNGRHLFHRASNPAENGLLEPDSLQQLWPHLGTEQSIAVEDAVTLNELAQQSEEEINWLVLDCLPAASLMQGGAQLLPQLDVALLRVAQDLPPELAADQQAVDVLLRAAGLRCIHIQAERHPALAHALYVRDTAQVQEQAQALDEQLKVAQEAWAKEKAELTHAMGAAAQQVQAAEQARALAQELAQKLGEQLTVAQEAWAKEKAELTHAMEAAAQQAQAAEQARALAQELAQKLGEQLTVAQETWATEKAELTQVREAANQTMLVAEQARLQAEAKAAQLHQELAQAKGERDERNKVANNRKKQIEKLESDKAVLVEQLAESQRTSEARQEQIRQLGQAQQEAVSVIAARWARAEGVVENWGDKLNPYLINALSQKPVAHVDDLVGWRKRPVHRVVGSGLGGMQPNEIYWGMGLIRREVIPPKRAGQICAVRGPLSRHRLLELDIPCPEVYGDPAVLLPLVFRPEKEAAHEYGVIQHFREATAQLPVPRIKGCEAPKVIDIRGGIENVVRDILSCKTIISSSLHGVISAHAYGRKAYWLKASDLPLGDDFKFHDYWASIGHTVYEPVLLDEEGCVVFGNSPSAPVPGFLDVDALLAACPFITKERCLQLIATRKKLASLGARGTPFGA